MSESDIVTELRLIRQAIQALIEKQEPTEDIGLADAAKIVGVSYRKMNILAKAGAVPGCRRTSMKGKFLFDRATIQRWREGRTL